MLALAWQEVSQPARQNAMHALPGRVSRRPATPACHACVAWLLDKILRFRRPAVHSRSTRLSTHADHAQTPPLPVPPPLGRSSLELIRWCWYAAWTACSACHLACRAATRSPSPSRRRVWGCGRGEQRHKGACLSWVACAWAHSHDGFKAQGANLRSSTKPMQRA